MPPQSHAGAHKSRKSQWGQPMCSIIVMILINFPCVSSFCHGLSLYPQSAVYIPFGEPLELFCVTENNFTANDLVFSHNEIVIFSEIVNRTTRRFYMENLEKQVLMLFCRNTKSKEICSTRVVVDLPPSNITDFNCISKNIEELKCSWTPINNVAFTSYSLELTVNNKTFNPCNVNRDGKKMYCTWKTNSKPKYIQDADRFWFYLRSCNVFGCIVQDFTINHFSSVKPDPPENLKVVINEPHSVLFSWNIPNNMVDLIDSAIVHRIEYKIPKIDNVTYFRSVDASNLKSRANNGSVINKKIYTFLLSELPYAHISYEVRICIKPENATDLYWSDFSYVLFTTVSEKPQRPPDTTVGAFQQSIYSGKRIIYVYWKQLEEYQEAGSNFTYKIVVKQDSHNTKTLLSDRNNSLSYVIINDVSFEDVHVSIWSTNDVGSSDNSSYLYIPPKKDVSDLHIHLFTKLGYENGTYKLSWIGVDNIDNYTLFWCQHNCVGRMNFTVLESEKNTYTIHLPIENRYQFAISANSGFRTTGMTWVSCDISKEKNATYNFPVRVGHDVPGKSFVKITWTMPCIDQEDFITGYNIKYCLIINSSNVCDNTFENESAYYINDPKQMEINITNLKSYKTYRFILELNTTYGLKPVDSAYTVVTTAEATPTNPRNVRLSNISYDSLVVSWDPPEYKNGIIGKYIILDKGQEIHVEKISNFKMDVGRRAVNVTGLKPFTMYSISVQACNIAIKSCSKSKVSDLIFVRTRIGPPST